MDWWTVGLGFLAGLLGALVGWFLLNGYFWAELQNIKRQANGAWGAANTSKGVAARDEENVELRAALTEAAAIMKGEGEAKDKGAALLQLAVKYPRAAGRLMREIKKSGIAEGAGLGELIG